MSGRIILHIDMDAYFASVEQALNPSLKGKPIAVTGAGKRTVITTSSYEARKYGVKTGMSVWEAKKACPNLVLTVGKNRIYTYTSAMIINIFKRFTPLVEVYSIDEAFLDITGSLSLFGGAQSIALGIKKRIREDFGLSCSIGIAPNKLLAKLASDMEKPDGLTVIRSEDVRALLEGLPVDRMTGIGRKTAAYLAESGVFTCGQLARFPESLLRKRFGIVGERLHNMALGIDDSPVVPVEESENVKSIGHSFTLEKDISSAGDIRRQILRLSEMVGRRARRHNYSGRTVTLVLRYSDFTTFSKRHSIDRYINQGRDIYKAADSILRGIRLRLPVRLVGVGLSGISKGPCQMELFDPRQKSEKAVEAMDAINDRYGEFSITYGELIGCKKHSQVISPSYRPIGPRKVDV